MAPTGLSSRSAQPRFDRAHLVLDEREADAMAPTAPKQDGLETATVLKALIFVIDPAVVTMFLNIQK